MTHEQYDQLFRDICELLDKIEIAFEAGDNEEVDEPLTSRFEIFMSHGFVVEIEREIFS